MPMAHHCGAGRPRRFRYALIATLLCILIGYPLAYVIAFRGGRYKNLLLVGATVAAGAGSAAP